jgi:hypothetical protein
MWPVITMANPSSSGD